jgi:hypothetical protein
VKRINLGKDSSGRALVIDGRTHRKLQAAERRLGHKLTIVQGSFRGGAGAAASAGTHDMAGVVDLRTWDLPTGSTPQQVVRVLRECGLIAWYRTKAQGFDPHIHAIDHGNPGLAPSAARQVTAWQQGLNGLASNGPDDGPRIPVPKRVPRKPTPNITAFRVAPTVGLRRAAARRIVKRGAAVDKRNARAWLAADADRVNARKRAGVARRKLINREVQ